MHLKPFLAACLIAAGATSAFAGDQTVSFDADGTASFIGTQPLLDGGDDVILFDGLAPGAYDFQLTLSGQYIDLTGLTLNGVAGSVASSGRLLFADVLGTGSGPFALTLAGSALNAQASYSGEFTVMPVPEPESYALLLAGLGAVGFMARRRRLA